MGNKKRILAWILSLAMVFGLFAGQVSVVKAANLGIYKFDWNQTNSQVKVENLSQIFSLMTLQQQTSRFIIS